MTPAGCTGELLRRLAAMPFLDRLEMVSVSGWSRGAVYPAIESLERNGLVAPVPHASDLVPPTRRFHLTVPGLYRLAREEGMTVDGLLAAYPPLRAVAAAADGAPGRRGRHLPARLYGLRRRPPHTLPLVQGPAHGRGGGTSRRAGGLHSQAGPHLRQDGLRQAPLAAEEGSPA